jgi:type I restriction enzyme S subunit
MKEFSRVQLREVVFIKGGKRLPLGEDFSTQKTSHPYIRARDIGYGNIRVQDAVYLSDEIAQKLSRYRVSKGDVCITIVGANVGEMGVVPPELNGANLTENAVRITSNGKIVQGFLKYTLLAQDALAQMKVLAGGAAQPKLGIYKIETIEIPLPSLPKQRKIAAILSAYDDLIDNNLRRIKILEEMTQNLYREWFVKFRFSGHQHARFTDSPLGRIPEGWEVATLGDHLIALESGKRPKGGAKDLAFGVPSVGAENIFGIGRHNYQSEKYVSREFFEGMRKGVVKDGDVALYKDGAYIGRSAYFRDSFPHAQFCVNEHVFLLRTTGKRLTQNILYLWLQEPATVSAIRATNANAAQPGINQTGVNGLSLIVLPLDIAGRFDQLAEPSLALIVSLAKRNEALRRTRDLLLPRLISGEVDVSELDIAVPE